jgi:hypothetical protein
VANDLYRSLRKRIEYGREHRVRRSSVGAVVATGTVRCARGSECLEAEYVGGRLLGGFIRRGQAFDLDHTDDRRGYLGASHARCNRVAGARKRWAKGPGPSREWVRP